MVEKDFVPPLDPALTQVPARELVSYESLLIEIEKLCRSECVRTLEYGQTPGRRKIHLLVISSPENLANLDRHKELAVRARRDLVRYRTLGDLEINEKVLAERQANAVPSVLIHCGAFGFEASHVEGGIQLANLLTNGGFPKASQILGNFIVLILPMVDPDGRMLAIKQWQEFPLCPAFAGVGNAQGFFLNRDYHRLSQAETRAVLLIPMKIWFFLVSMIRNTSVGRPLSLSHATRTWNPQCSLLSIDSGLQSSKRGGSVASKLSTTQKKVPCWRC